MLVYSILSSRRHEAVNVRIIAERVYTRIWYYGRQQLPRPADRSAEVVCFLGCPCILRMTKEAMHEYYTRKEQMLAGKWHDRSNGRLARIKDSCFMGAEGWASVWASLARWEYLAS